MYVLYVWVYVEKKYIMIRASGITGVASHGKHTRATEHVKKYGYGNFVRAQIFLAENFVQFCSPIFSHVRWLRVCLPWQCYPKECLFVSIIWLMIDKESCFEEIMLLNRET